MNNSLCQSKLFLPLIRSVGEPKGAAVTHWPCHSLPQWDHKDDGYPGCPASVAAFQVNHPASLPGDVSFNLISDLTTLEREYVLV